MNGPVKGWAVAQAGVFNIRTVSDTRRSAIINWLFLNAGPVYQWDSDEKNRKDVGGRRGGPWGERA